MCASLVLHFVPHAKVQSVLYVGNDKGLPTPQEFRLFDYDPDVVVEERDLVEANTLAPDDPNGIAPREGVELWVIEVKEVVSLPAFAPGGVALRR